MVATSFQRRLMKEIVKVSFRALRKRARNELLRETPERWMSHVKTAKRWRDGKKKLIFRVLVMHEGVPLYLLGLIRTEPGRDPSRGNFNYCFCHSPSSSSGGFIVSLLLPGEERK